MRLESIHCRELHEATTPWMGPLTPQLGTNESYTLNFGGNPGRPPMLYVPVPLSRVRYAIRAIRSGAIVPTTTDGGEPPSRARLTHVGEAHATISMGPELGGLGPDPTAALRRSGLFDETGRGVRVEVRHTGQYKWLRASFYKDEADPAGPMLVAEVVQIPQLRAIRETLGMTSLPQIPGIAHYIPHVTVGYLPKLNLIHQSYLAQRRP